MIDGQHACHPPGSEMWQFVTNTGVFSAKQRGREGCIPIPENRFAGVQMRWRRKNIVTGNRRGTIGTSRGGSSKPHTTCQLYAATTSNRKTKGTRSAAKANFVFIAKSDSILGCRLSPQGTCHSPAAEICHRTLPMWDFSTVLSHS